QQSYREDVDFDEQLAQLSKLGQLRDQGILTQQEFEAKKRQILGV
ncbi:MAG: virion core protein, partial [Firmicutes bacterium HGW-Firmicutes-5]